MRLSIALGITLSYYLVSAVSDDTGDKTGTGILAVSSPAWLAEFRGPSESAQGHMFNVDDSIKTSLLDTVNGLDLSRYPQPSKRPPVDDPEVKAVIDQLDWSKVPKISKRRLKGEGELDMQGYDTKVDPDCWWSSTTCKEPRLNYIPEDVSFCPRAGDWGLNYDDGPFRVWSKDAAEQKWQEPRLYNYLAEQNNQKATLFCKHKYVSWYLYLMLSYFIMHRYWFQCHLISRSSSTRITRWSYHLFAYMVTPTYDNA